MIDEAQNKMMDGSSSKNKSADMPTTILAVSVVESDYFFPGGGVWKPMTARAATIQDAEELHRVKREPVTAEPKVEESETNNE
jgi:hypothetical protein